MTTTEDLLHIVTVLAECAPGEVVESVGVQQLDGDILRIDVMVRQPSPWVGRRGATADAIRTALTARLGVTNVQLNFQFPG